MGSGKSSSIRSRWRWLQEPGNNASIRTSQERFHRLLSPRPPLCCSSKSSSGYIVSSAVYKEELQAQNLSFLQRFRGQSCEEQDSLPLLRESMSRMICSERSNGHLMLPSAPPIFVTSGHCFITQPPAAAGSFHPNHHH